MSTPESPSPQVPKSLPHAILDFPDRDGRPVRRGFFDPVDVVTARRVEEVRGALRAVERAASAGLYVVGYVGYEAAPAFDPALAVHSGSADAAPLVRGVS